MGRKRRESENLIVSLLVFLPWWTSLAIGACYAAYLWFYPLMPHANKAPIDLWPESAAISRQMCLPIFIITGIISLIVYLGQRQRHLLLQRQDSQESIRELTWQKFELLVGALFRQHGYQVIENGGGGADGGIDLELRKDNERILVQCKQWRTWRVGVKPIRELYGVLMHEHASRAIFVTCGDYTAEAASFAVGKPIELIDGAQLLKMIEAVKPSNAANERVLPRTPLQQLTTTSTTTLPGCPKCGKAMVIRTAKQGKYAGQQFYGCSNYPHCSGVRDIE